MKVAKYCEASGAIGRLKRRKPYPPILSVMAARITEPPVGASTGASGSHVCTGHIGTLTAKDMDMARKINFCAVSVSAARGKSRISKRPLLCWYREMNETSVRGEPSSVQRQYLTSA